MASEERNTYHVQLRNPVKTGMKVAVGFLIVQVGVLAALMLLYAIAVAANPGLLL